MSQEITNAKVKRQYKRKAKPRLIALEPRMLFDGAAVATVVDIQTQASAEASTASAALETSTLQNSTADAFDTLANIANANSTGSNSIDPIATDTTSSTQNTIEAIQADLFSADTKLTTLAQPAGINRHELVVVDGQLDDLQALLDDMLLEGNCFSVSIRENFQFVVAGVLGQSADENVLLIEVKLYL